MLPLLRPTTLCRADFKADIQILGTLPAYLLAFTYVFSPRTSYIARRLNHKCGLPLLTAAQSAPSHGNRLTTDETRQP